MHVCQGKMIEVIIICVFMFFCFISSPPLLYYCLSRMPWCYMLVMQQTGIHLTVYCVSLRCSSQFFPHLWEVCHWPWTERSGVWTHHSEPGCSFLEDILERYRDWTFIS